MGLNTLGIREKQPNTLAIEPADLFSRRLVHFEALDINNMVIGLGALAILTLRAITFANALALL